MTSRAERRADWLATFGSAPVDVWWCPIRSHQDRLTDDGWPVVTVEWRDGVAYCTDPDCDRSSADPERA